MFYGLLVLCVSFALCALALPAGGAVKRDEGPQCSPAEPSDILQFFITNYAAFAFTVITSPGTKLAWRIQITLNAFLFPFTGIVKGCKAIAQAKRRSDSDLDHMAKAGALCTVVRGPNWKPRTGQVIRGCRLLSTERRSGIVMFRDGVETPVTAYSKYKNLSAEYQSGFVRRDLYDIFGHVSDDIEAAGFLLKLVHPDTKVKPIHGSEYLYESAGSSSYLKGLIAIGQLIFACITLYQTTRGSVGQFGYAAYGFTVLQYAAMSFVNLAAQLVCPSYPTLFMVRSEIMDEAEQAGVKFDGVVGIIDQENNGDDELYREAQHGYHDIRVEHVEICTMENTVRVNGVGGDDYRTVVITYSLINSVHHEVKSEKDTRTQNTTLPDQKPLIQEVEDATKKLQTGKIDYFSEMYYSSIFISGPFKWVLEEWHRRQVNKQDWSRRAGFVALLYHLFILPPISRLLGPPIRANVTRRFGGQLVGLDRALDAHLFVVLQSITPRAILYGTPRTPALFGLRLRNEVNVPITGRVRIGKAPKWPRLAALAFGVFAICIPYIVIAALSGFKAQQSTVEQRGWMLAWLVGGQVLGARLAWAKAPNPLGVNQKYYTFLIVHIVLALCYGAPAIGGMVTVVQQLRNFGTCSGMGNSDSGLHF